MATSAVLLMNLGSPTAPTREALKPYLNEFLMDERVIDVPYWWRTILVKGIIVPFRAAKSAEAYRSIWTDQGSPLMVISKQLREAVANQTELPVALCMRYGQPSPKTAITELMNEYPSLKEIILVPLYPHYAWSSYETAVAYVEETVRKEKFLLTIKTVPPFYQDPSYIQALATSIQPYLQKQFDLLVFSYHGIPERHITKRHPAGTHDVKSADRCCDDPAIQATCYRHQVITTTKLVAETLGIPAEKYTLSFQSRLGRDPWLQPYTAKKLGEWPKEGYKKILVVCPAFVSDCLETLEEMGEEGKELFLQAGGTAFTLIPCMNTNPKWVDCVIELINRQR